MHALSQSFLEAAHYIAATKCFSIYNAMHVSYMNQISGDPVALYLIRNATACLLYRPVFI